MLFERDAKDNPDWPNLSARPVPTEFCRKKYRNAAILVILVVEC
jgi:hypothetical protein